MNDQAWLYQTDDLEKALAFRVQRASRVLRVHLSRFLADFGLDVSQEQYFILFKVQAKPGCSQSDLADQLLGDYPNVTRLVDSLVERGLVERRQDPTDRRRHAVYLTDRGQEITQRLVPAILEQRRKLYAGLTADEIEVFRTVIDKIELRAAELAGLIPPEASEE